jgi:hypothetical protein
MASFKSLNSFVSLFFCNLCLSAQQLPIHQAFVLQESPAVVEGMAYDPVDSNFYFGENLSLKILRYSKSGKPVGKIDAGKDGITSIVGINVSAVGQLWVCGSMMINNKKSMCLYAYEINSGKLVGRFADTSAKAGMFNDVAITSTGNVYTTDTHNGSLYKVDTDNKMARLYLQSDSLRNCNGITAHGEILYISTSRGFARINTIDKQISMLNVDRFMIAGNDGLYYYDHSLIAIQNVLFPVMIGRYFLDSNEHKIVKATALSADDSLLVIPTTGAVVNDEFYFMANSNIETYDFDNQKPLQNFKPKVIVVVKMNLSKHIK